MPMLSNSTPTSADLVAVSALYLGASKVDHSVVENAISAVQPILTSYFPDEKADSLSGQPVVVKVTNTNVCIEYVDQAIPNLAFPVKFITYVGAIKKALIGSKYVFETLNKIELENQARNVKAIVDPPLLVLVFKGIGNYVCHVLATNDQSDALKIVNVIMQVYHNLQNTAQDQRQSFPSPLAPANITKNQQYPIANRPQSRFMVRSGDGSILSNDQIGRDPNILRALNLAQSLSTGANKSQQQQQKPPNVFVRYLDNPESSDVSQDQIIIRETDRQTQQRQPVIVDKSSVSPPSQQPLIIERWLPPCGGMGPQTKKPTKFILPLTVKEVKMITPKPIVIQQLRPVFQTRKRIIHGGGQKTVRRLNDQSGSCNYNVRPPGRVVSSISNIV